MKIVEKVKKFLSLQLCQKFIMGFLKLCKMDDLFEVRVVASSLTASNFLKNRLAGNLVT